MKVFLASLVFLLVWIGLLGYLTHLSMRDPTMYRALALWLKDAFNLKRVKSEPFATSLNMAILYIGYLCLGMFSVGVFKQWVKDWYFLWLNASLLALITAIFTELIMSVIHPILISVDQILMYAFAGLLGAALMLFILKLVVKPTTLV